MKLLKTKHRRLALHLKSANKKGARKIVAFNLASDQPIPAYLLNRLLTVAVVCLILLAGISLPAQTTKTGTSFPEWNKKASEKVEFRLMECSQEHLAIDSIDSGAGIVKKEMAAPCHTPKRSNRYPVNSKAEKKTIH